jgi:hypothetical protein
MEGLPVASCVEMLSHRFSIAESKNCGFTVSWEPPQELDNTTSSASPHALLLSKGGVGSSALIHLRTDPPDFGSEILDFGSWCM